MKIVALEFYKNGEMREAFALGGSMKKEDIKKNATVYLSTHTPEALNSLDKKSIMLL